MKGLSSANFSFQTIDLTSFVETFIEITFNNLVSGLALFQRYFSAPRTNLGAQSLNFNEDTNFNKLTSLLVRFSALQNKKKCLLLS